MLKRSLYVAAGLLVLGLLAWRVTGAMRTAAKPAAPPKRPPVAIEVAEVRRAAIRDVRLLSGEVRPDYRYEIVSRVPGRVTSIGKRVGDRVVQGEIVARIDDAEFRQEAAEAEAALKTSRHSLAETRTQVELARRELARMRELEKGGLASRAELEQAEAALEALESRGRLYAAQIEQREAALASAAIRLGYATLAAPRAGIVSERRVDEGGSLEANAAALTVVGIDRVTVLATVVERLYGRLSVGQAAEVEVDAYPGRWFPGTIARIAPVLVEASRLAEMEIGVPNPGLLLRPGMFARVRVVLEERPDALVVPIAAVMTRNGGSGVWLLAEDGQTARFVPVETGMAAEGTIEILSPPLAGRVVTMGQHLLEEGAPVALPAPAGRERS
jgi:RND family efflux transporter MFP subunit